MGLKGYYIEPNFFSGNPQKEEVTFYLTDGGKNNGNICRIKEVIISVDYDTYLCVVNIPNAYGKKAFIAEFTVGNEYGLNKLSKFIDEVKEWLGVRNSWRGVSSEGKKLTLLRVCGNAVEKTEING